MTRKGRFAGGRCWRSIRTLALLLSCFVLAATAQEDDVCHIKECTCVVYSSGNMEIDCSNQGFTQVPDLSEVASNLTQLDLQGNKITELRVADFANLMKLTKLELRNNKIRSIKKDTFSEDNIPLLEQLDLRDNEIRSIEGGAFSQKNAPRLMFLFLANNQLQSLPDDVFEGASLESLDLSFNELTAPPRALGRTEIIKSDLKLNNNSFGVLRADAFEGFSADKSGPTDLNLSYCGLTHFAPEAFMNLAGLTTLRLDGNRFQQLNRSLLGHVTPSLARLFLRSSSVEEIQAGTFARLKSLRELYLSGNRLKTLYANTFRGDKAGGLSFDVLDLSYSGIEDIRRLSLRTRVETLWLNGNNIRVIHNRDFMDLEGVRELVLTRSNIEEIIGTPFVNLTDLSELYLNRNFLGDEDVVAITNSSRLHFLDLSSNILTRVPNLNGTNFPLLSDLVLFNNSIRRLHREHVRNMSTVLNLNIKANGLEEIDDDAFQELVNLRILDIERSELTRLPSLQPLKKLVNLHVSHSKLKSLPHDLCENNAQLIILDATNNDIAEVPPLTGCKALFAVQLDFNEITSLLDDQFANLPLLEVLSLENNKLQILPEDAFANLTNLKEVYLHRNSLEEYPVGIFEQSGQLTYLDVGFNNIRELRADAFANNSQLREIDFNNNMITRIDPNAFPPGMIQLLTLNISSNDISSWELPMGGFSYLRTLSMQNMFRLHQVPKPSEIPRIQDLELTYSYHCCVWSDFRLENSSGSGSDGEDTTEPPTTVAPEDLEPVTIPPDIIHTFDDNPFVAECINHPENPITDQIRAHVQSVASLFGLTVVILDNCKVEFFDPNGNPIGFSDDDFFENAPEIVILEPPTVPPWRQIRCIPHETPLTPCQNLMDPWFLRVAVWAVWVLAVLGNGTVLFVMLIAREKIDAPQFFICNLAFADFCLGVYLAFLAVVDIRTYGDRSFYQSALDWQLGPGCKTAGLIAIFSSELSVFILGGLTLERVHTIASAFSVNERSRMRAAVVVVIISWVFAGVLALLPLVGVNSYTQVAVCLPFVTEHLRDRLYIGLIISINLFTFLVILISYIYIFCSIRRSPAANAERKEIFNAAAKIAILIFATFACWFPLALIAYSALNGSPLVDAGQAKYFIVFVYPLNACINPFVYAIFTRQFRDKLWSICKRKRRPTLPVASSDLRTQRPVHDTMVVTSTRGSTIAEDLMRIRQSRRAYSVQLADRNPVKSPTPPILAFPGPRSGRRSSLPAILGNSSLCAAHEQHVYNQSRRGSNASIVSATSAVGSGANTPAYPLPFRLGPLYHNRSLPELLEEEEIELEAVREKLEAAISESHASSESGMRRLSVVREESETDLFEGADCCDKPTSDASVMSANSEEHPDTHESLTSDPSLQVSEALPTPVQFALGSGSQTDGLRSSPAFSSSASSLHEISVSPMEERIDSQVCDGYASSTEMGCYSPAAPNSPLSTRASSSPCKMRFHCTNPLVSFSSLDGNCGSESGDLARSPIHNSQRHTGQTLSPRASSGSTHHNVRHPAHRFPVHHRQVLANRGTSRSIVRIENPRSLLNSTVSATDV